MREILSGVAYLHDIGIIHRDIKLDNIMMCYTVNDKSEESAVPKLIDFGLATICTMSDKKSDPFGTIAYCSPEIIQRKPYNQIADMWSLGVVFYVLLSGYFPFIAKEKK